MSLSQASDPSTLPLDVLLRILAFCEIPAIIRIRQCSKHFNDVTRHHGVWFCVLKDLCNSMGITVHSFAPGFETMSAYQLEAYSTRHLLFRYKAFQHTKLKIGNSFEIRRRRIEPPGSGIYRVRVLRGGRFIVAASAIQLFLWDMDFGMSSEPKLICSTPLIIPATYVTMDMNQFSDTLHMVISSSPFQDPGRLLLKYELNFRSTSTLKFRYIGKFTAPRDSTNFFVGRKKVAFLCCTHPNHIIGVHDFESGSTITFHTRTHHRCVAILGKDETHVVASGGKTIDVYSLASSLVASPPETVAFQTAGTMYAYFSIMSVNSSSSLDLDTAVVDACGRTHEQSDELVGSSIHLNKYGRVAFQKTTLRCRLDRYLDLERTSVEPVFTTFSPSCSLKAFWWCTDNDEGDGCPDDCFVYFASLTKSDDEEEGNNGFKVCIIPDRKFSAGAIWFDPFSGRTAYVDGGEIVLMDYLD